MTDRRFTRASSLLAPDGIYPQRVMLGAMSYSNDLPGVEHAYETKQIHLCSQNDIYIKRRGGDDYVQYWKSLTGEDFAVVELNGAIDACENLSQLLLGNPDALTQILERCTGQAIVGPFSPSKTERKVSDLLDMPLWGAPKAWETVGRKSSLLALAGGAGIPIPDSHRLDQSFDPNTLLGLCASLKQQGYQNAIVKSDLGIAGRGHWKFSLVDFDRQAADSLVAQIRNAEEEGSHYVKSSFVLEGWVENAVSIGCYLDVLEDGAVHPVWYWQQLFAPGGTAYLGAQSLGLAEEVEADLLDILHSLGNALAERGFYGSFGPDFLWHEESGFRLLEVNARLPATAFAFHAADKIGRDVSKGFFLKHLHLKEPMHFSTLKQVLGELGVLLTDKGDTKAGVVALNYGLLPFGEVELLALGPSNAHCRQILQKIETVICR